MALNSYSLTTVARIKQFLGITVATHDTILERLINSATDFIEKECGGRRFKQTAYSDEEYNGTGTEKLVLRQWPVSTTATTQLEERDTANNQSAFSAINSQDYFIQYDQGILEFSAADAFGIAKNSFTKLPRHWRVTYTAGYDYDNAATFLSDVGAGDLEQACWMLVRDIFNKRATAGDIKQESIGNYSVEYLQVLEKNQEVQEMINKYRRPQAF